VEEPKKTTRFSPGAAGDRCRHQKRKAKKLHGILMKNSVEAGKGLET
jgi:hypothetical protein